MHRVINHAVGSVLPHGLQRGILDGIFILGRAQLSDFILNEKNPLGYSRLAKLRRIFEEGKSLQLQFPAEDLGFRYHHDSTILVSALKLLLFIDFLLPEIVPKSFKGLYIELLFHSFLYC